MQTSQEPPGSPGSCSGQAGWLQGSSTEQVGCLGHCHFADGEDKAEVPRVVGNGESHWLSSQNRHTFADLGQHNLCVLVVSLISRKERTTQPQRELFHKSLPSAKTERSC